MEKFYLQVLQMYVQYIHSWFYFCELFCFFFVPRSKIHFWKKINFIFAQLGTQKCVNFYYLILYNNKYKLTIKEIDYYLAR
jgi:hypothetical protein